MKEFKESYIEKSCINYAKSKGWLTHKFVSPNNKGVPDRLFIKKGYVLFVEFKSTKGKVTPLQKLVIDTLVKSGARVEIINNIDNFKNLINSIEINSINKGS